MSLARVASAVRGPSRPTGRGRVAGPARRWPHSPLGEVPPPAPAHSARWGPVSYRELDFERVACLSGSTPAYPPRPGQSLGPAHELLGPVVCWISRRPRRRHAHQKAARTQQGAMGAFLAPRRSRYGSRADDRGSPHFGQLRPRGSAGTSTRRPQPAQRRQVAPPFFRGLPAGWAAHSDGRAVIVCRRVTRPLFLLMGASRWWPAGAGAPRRWWGRLPFAGRARRKSPRAAP